MAGSADDLPVGHDHVDVHDAQHEGDVEKAVVVGHLVLLVVLDLALVVVVVVVRVRAGNVLVIQLRQQLVALCSIVNNS